MLSFRPLLAAGALFFAFLLCSPIHAQQPTQGGSSSSTTPLDPASQQLPQQGELGSPFPVEHAWNHIAFELGASFSPMVEKGAGYFGSGVAGNIGVIDRVTPHWRGLAEFQIFAQRGHTWPQSLEASESARIVSADAAALYDFNPHESSSVYLVGGPAYYHLSAVTYCPGPDPCDGSAFLSTDAQNVAADAAGFEFGLGLRHRISSARQSELFLEARYHYIASGASVFGQVSLLPVGGGIRW